MRDNKTESELIAAMTDADLETALEEVAAKHDREPESAGRDFLGRLMVRLDSERRERAGLKRLLELPSDGA